MGPRPLTNAKAGIGEPKYLKKKKTGDPIFFCFFFMWALLGLSLIHI